MTEILIGAGMYLITELSKTLGKMLGRELEKKYVIGVLVIVLGAVYVFLEGNQPELLLSMTEFVSKSFATSQAMYLVINKYLS